MPQRRACRFTQKPQKIRQPVKPRAADPKRLAVALLAALTALLAALAGAILSTALLLLSGFLLPALLAAAALLGIALALLIVLILLPFVVRHWTFSGLWGWSTSQAQCHNADLPYIVPFESAQICAKCL